MRFSQAALKSLLTLSAVSTSTVVLLDAFAPQASKTVSRNGRLSSNKRHDRSNLQMAFRLTEEQKSKGNVMFDGPTPLVKERDACGVGFVANTSSGGMYFCYFSVEVI